MSKPYYQDRLMWCTQKARHFPLSLNIWFVMTPTVLLILIFGIGYVSGFVLYIFVQFDLEYQHRNQRDWHYTTWLIMLPAVCGLNQRFHPKYTVLRIFYSFLLTSNACVFFVVFCVGIDFLKIPLQRWQISTINDIAGYEYRLFGSQEVQQMISYDNRVRSISPSQLIVDNVFRIFPFFLVQTIANRLFLCVPHH